MGVVARESQCTGLPHPSLCLVAPADRVQHSLDLLRDLVTALKFQEIIELVATV